MIEAGITSLLLANSALAGLVTDRIFPLVLPESPTYPAATYQVISSIPQYTNDGPMGVTRSRIEFDAWADTYAACKAVARAIRNVLDGYSGPLSDGTVVANATVVNVTDTFDAEARLYRVQTDYSFWHTV